MKYFIVICLLSVLMGCIEERKPVQIKNIAVYGQNAQFIETYSGQIIATSGDINFIEFFTAEDSVKISRNAIIIITNKKEL